MSFPARLLVSVAVLLSFADRVRAQQAPGANGRFSCIQRKTKLVALTQLPFADGTPITDQLRMDGLLFSAGDIAVGNVFPFSDTSIVNPGNISFDTGDPVVSVSLTFMDFNSNLQQHFLQAFDQNGRLVDEDMVVEDASSNAGAYLFTLTVSSCQGIAYVVASEFPPGAKTVRRIVYSTTERANPASN